MDYFVFQIETDPTQCDLLIALFSSLPFESFEEKETGFDAYLAASFFTRDVEHYLQELQAKFNFTYQKRHLPAQNWNKVWESNFHSVAVDDFVGIRADFHPPMQHVMHELVINPKMAFGTGHHETTWMVMKSMQELSIEGADVLDFGCGTGVLAILASKLGARVVTAVDIEEAAIENTLENCQVNGIHNVVAICGKLEDVPHHSYGVVLANINRNVILQSLTSLSGMVDRQGWLVVSGFISADEKMMRHALEQYGFSVEKILKRNNWLALICQKINPA